MHGQNEHGPRFNFKEQQRPSQDQLLFQQGNCRVEERNQWGHQSHGLQCLCEQQQHRTDEQQPHAAEQHHRKFDGKSGTTRTLSIKIFLRFFVENGKQ